MLRLECAMNIVQRQPGDRISRINRLAKFSPDGHFQNQTAYTGLLARLNAKRSRRQRFFVAARRQSVRHFSRLHEAGATDEWCGKR